MGRDDLVQLLGRFWDFLGTGFGFVVTNLTAILGFVLALLIIRRVLSEKRNPSNFFAWFFLVLFAPLVGAPLYFLFGGRKSRRMARIKREISERTRKLTGNAGVAPGAGPVAHLTQHNPTIGNHCELLPDGEIAFARLCDEIEKAEHHIHIATYILGKDETGNEIVERLARRAKDGVTVRLLLDSLGSWNRSRMARYRIRRAGGEVAMFLPVLPLHTKTSGNLRNHRKIAIFDNYRAITGGQNLDNRFLGREPSPDRFVDFSVVTQGPAVAELNATFLGDWAFAQKESPDTFKELLAYTPEEAGDSTIEVIMSGPDVTNDPLWETILLLIQEFKKELTIITPYFIPDDVLFQSLIVKARTGRQIRLVLPLHSNHPLTDIARYSYLRKLDDAGVEILLYKPRMLHGKLILADEKVALIGSANIDMRSLFVNFEIALAHYSPGDIAAFGQWASDVIEDCVPFEAVRKDRSLMPNRLAEELVHLVSPML